MKWFKAAGKNATNTFVFWFLLIFNDLFNFLFFVVSISVYCVWVYRNRNSQSVTFDEFIFWALVAIFVPTITALISNFSRYEESLRKCSNYSCTLLLSDKFVDLLKNSINIDIKKVGVIKRFMDKLAYDFGGVVIGANVKEYVDTLMELSDCSHESFYATLRGGEKPEYNIEWFFQNTPKEEEKDIPVILTSNQKKNYLKKINGVNVPKDSKVRIIILREDEMSTFKNDAKRNEFFDLSNEINTFLIGPDLLAKNLVSQELPKPVNITNSLDTSFIWEDYAVFDKRICVKLYPYPLSRQKI